MDAIFKALADPSRRALLDALREADGQTQTELEARLDMTRFGVAKHLATLEAAGLVTRVKRGRFVHHYLNAAPLAEALAAWVAPYAAPAAALLDLKSRLENPMDASVTAKPGFVLQTFIRCTQDALWRALTDPEQIARYHFMARRVEADGDRLRLVFGKEEAALVQGTLRVEPRSLIEASFEPQWEGGGAPSRTVFRIDPEGEVCRLTVEHYDLTFPVVPGQGVADGWARWAAGLKTWLETGERLAFEEAAAA